MNCSVNHKNDLRDLRLNISSAKSLIIILLLLKSASLHKQTVNYVFTLFPKYFHRHILFNPRHTTIYDGIETSITFVVKKWSYSYKVSNCLTSYIKPGLSRDFSKPQPKKEIYLSIIEHYHGKYPSRKGVSKKEIDMTIIYNITCRSFSMFNAILMVNQQPILGGCYGNYNVKCNSKVCLHYSRAP